MTDDVLRSLPVEEIAPDRVEFEIKVLPEETDVVITVEETNRRQDELARAAAETHFLQTCTGVYLPLPDLASWPERYRRAFEEELARLKAYRFGRGEGGPS